MPRPPDPTDEIFVDLHGATLSEAPARVQESLRQAFRARTKRVIFVHGVGNHSEAGTAPLATRVREFLKALLDTPRAAIGRIEFGEESRELGRNPGCVRVTLSLQLARDEVAYAPRVNAGQPTHARLEKKRTARRTPDAITKQEREALEQAEELLRRKFGEPGLGANYRRAQEKDGDWPGQR